MELSLESRLANGYKSPAQKARVLTEGWVVREGYCPSCGQAPIVKYPDGKPVADFVCPDCGEDYELKSSRQPHVNRIVDGAYFTMMKRLRDSRNPSLFLLSYDPAQTRVRSFMVVPKHFFTPDLIEKRQPLSVTARRAGWVGCNILLHTVPPSGKIFLVRDGKEEPRDRVLGEWQRTLFLRHESDIGARDWLLDVMHCVENLNTKEFSLEALYDCEKELQDRHPRNKHIREKIRQQLQVLRNKGYLDFIGAGTYRLRK